MEQQGFNLAGRRLYIATPAYDHKVTMKYATALAALTDAAALHGITIKVGSICGCSVVSRARNMLVKEFLDSDCTELLFIDSDINFTPDSVFRLMAFGEDPDKGIIGGVPRTREDKLRYICELDDADGHVVMNGQGLVRATHIATAFMWVRRNVFEDLISAHPEWKYFDHRSQEDTYAVFDFETRREGYVGEDYLFCERAREAGYEVWVDPSIQLGHMGIKTFQGNFGEDVLFPMIRPADGFVTIGSEDDG